MQHPATCMAHWTGLQRRSCPHAAAAPQPQPFPWGCSRAPFGEEYLDDGEGRAEGLEASDGEAGTPGDKLKECSLVILVILGHDLEQVPHTLAVHGVAMVRLATITQHLKIRKEYYIFKLLKPFNLYFVVPWEETLDGSTEYLVQFIRIEHG